MDDSEKAKAANNEGPKTGTPPPRIDKIRRESYLRDKKTGRLY